MAGQFNVLICGAGIAGLCAAISIVKKGHRVVVLDEAHQLSPIGVGIHIPPNCSRILQAWGVVDRFEGVALKPGGTMFRRYENGAVIGTAPSPPQGESPYWSIRRSDYQRILHEVAVELGCEFRLAAKVVSCDPDAPSVTLASGETIEADFIVAADGIRSVLRKYVIPEEDVSPIVNPLASYRASVTSAQLLADPGTAPLVENPSTNVWMGYSRHAICYPISNGGAFSLGGTHPGKFGVGEWNRPGDLAELRNQFRSFDPVVQSIFAKVTDCKQWTLAEVPRLPRWVSSSGKVVLVGDAAHAMLPFLAQGGAMASEDGAALGECIARAKIREDIPHVLRIFERIRKRRCETAQLQTRRNGEVIHLPDGEEREERDRAIAGEPLKGNQPVDAGPWFDVKFRKWLFGHNVVEYSNQVLDNFVKRNDLRMRKSTK